MAQLPDVRPPPPSPAPQPGLSVREAFIAGWYAGGGSDALLPRTLAIIACESGWDVYAYNPAGPYNGLGQWDTSWWSYGGGDIHDPWQQGHNMATRVRRDGGFGAWGC